MFKALRRTTGLALVAGLMAVAVPAQAIPVVTGPTGGTFSKGPGPAGKFVDVYTYTIPIVRKVTIFFSQTTVNYPADNLNFGSNGQRADVTFGGMGSLDPSAGSFKPGSGKIIPGNGPISSNGTETFQLTQILQPGAHNFRLTGTSSGLGSYSGTLSFAGVPEPSVWLMMILGFGFVGAAMRERKTSTTVSYA